MKRLAALELSLILLGTPAVGQVPASAPVAYTHARSMTIGTLYPIVFNPSTPNQAPVSAIMINCTATGNVVLLLGDQVSQVTVTLPSAGVYILPFQVAQVLTAGTTASATYTQLG